MPEKEINPPEKKESEPKRRRRLLTRRRLVILVGVIAGLALVAFLLTVVLYRYGVYDSYIKAKFVAKMDEIGVVFDADVFRLTVTPLELELKNATFSDRITGEKLFFIRDARLDLSVQNLYAWELSRDISIDKTEVHGAEVWVKFDENGRSNFANLHFVENEPGTRVNFKYQSGKFLIADSVAHFGDISRKLSGDANNVVFSLEPEDVTVPDEQKRYNFDLASTDSHFEYDTRSVDDIDIRAIGVADRNGADFTHLDLKTPIGESFLSGHLTDWAAPKYNFDIQSSIDLTQTSNLFSPGTPVSGVGNFKGNVTGEGETYKIVGEADSAGLRAGGVYLKALNVAATVAGTNTNYEANGTAIAQMLTFEDFRVDFLKMIGNVRGTGTDFRWFGELQAVAASTPKLTLGGLYLSDALAEYKDRQFRAEAGNGRVKRFAIGDTEFEDLQARAVKFSLRDGLMNISGPNAQARRYKSKDFDLQGIAGKNVRVGHRKGETTVDIDNVSADSASVKGNKANNVSVDEFRFSDVPDSTRITGKNFRASRADIGGALVDGLESPMVELENTRAGLVVYADKFHVAKIDTGAAILGSINIGGVRLTIRQGVVEARSDDIDAGTVTLAKTNTLPGGGALDAVRIQKPVFILEPSGHYRATADMSLGGGALGSVSLGAARAKVEATNDHVALNELNADIMNGKLSGTAVIALNDRAESTLLGDFSDLDIGKLLALQGGRVIPIEGQTTGRVDLKFNGTKFRNATGTVNASISANAGTADQGLIPVNGQIKVSATNGLFNVDVANLNSAKSRLTATGRFDLKDENSELNLALRSSDASEIDRLIRVLGVSTDLEHQLDNMQVEFAGNLSFDGDVSGNLTDPTINGRAALDSLSMRGRLLGGVSTDILRSPTGVELRNGKLLEAGGGNALFTINMPRAGQNNTAIKATLTNINAGNLLAALPVTLPERIRDLNGQTSGTIDISGLPNEAQGVVDLAAASGIIAGQNFDGLKVKAVFSGTLIDVQQAEMRVGAGLFTAKGKYDRGSDAFDMDLSGKAIPSPLLLAFLPKDVELPVVAGDVDFTARAEGIGGRASTYNINFNGVAANVLVNENSLGRVEFKGQTTGQVLTADLTAGLDGHPQVINASVNFGDENMPFVVATDFNQSPLAPFLAFIPQVKGMPITGTGTGRVEFGGNLTRLDDQGKRVFTSSNLSGKAEFTQLALQIQDTPLSAAEPVLITFNTREINFEKARFAGGGSNMTIAGIKALTDDGINSLSIDGRVNLNLLNLTTKDTFFSGFADTSIRLSGPNSTAHLSGTANIVNGSVATFLGSDRFTVDRLKARIIFTSNQVQVEEATGYLGGGKFTASGGGLLGSNDTGSGGNSALGSLALQAFRFSLDGHNVTVPLPKDFMTTGDAQLEVSGLRRVAGEDLQVTISGRVNARRAIYSKDIDLANLIGGRRDTVLTSGGSSLTAPRFDLVIEGRDALQVKNNIADLTASVSLVLTGDADNPRLSGRITANSGTILFRKDRYEVQRGVLEFPPDTAIEPVINLQAESEIAGYQVFVNLSGPLKDSEQLTATVRSSPALPQADVVSLITTGNLANTTGGIPTLAQTGINTAAEILTDAIINNPVRKATDKLFGLNVFEIDPLISGQNIANPSARLTVGRQINNKLRVTYSTNLSQDQNQVLALEYRVSNKLSVVAQFEQRPLSNVTRNRENFSVEIRFRKRF